MPGRPIRQRFLRDVRAFGDWPAVFALIAHDGLTTRDVAARFNVSRTFFQDVVRQEGQLEALRAARREKAALLLEEAQEIVDDVPATRDEVAKARARADTRLRLAGLLDREQFGQTRGPVVEVNIGQLHLDALRAKRIEDEAAERQRLTDGATGSG